MGDEVGMLCEVQWESGHIGRKAGMRIATGVHIVLINL